VRIGAHVRTPGGLRTAVESARAVGAEAAQLFISNPRAWSGPRLDTAEKFGADWKAGDIGPLFVHAPYLVNIASPNPDFVAKSVELCRRSVAACDVIGAAGFVVHAGAGGRGDRATALERAASSISAIGGAGTTPVLVELMAATAGAVASTLPEARELFDAVSDDRLRLCLDTCHLFVTGYALDEPEGVGACFVELDDVGLAEQLTLIHTNDAKFDRGSRRDRHEVIGQGRIGVEGFRAVLARPELADLTLVLETPADQPSRTKEIALLRSLAPPGPRGA
jgi:deoxyribonuclease-4